MARTSFLSSYVMLTKNVCQNLNQCHRLYFHFHYSWSPFFFKKKNHVASGYIDIDQSLGQLNSSLWFRNKQSIMLTWLISSYLFCVVSLACLKTYLCTKAKKQHLCFIKSWIYSWWKIVLYVIVIEDLFLLSLTHTLSNCSHGLPEWYTLRKWILVGQVCLIVRFWSASKWEVGIERMNTKASGTC